MLPLTERSRSISRSVIPFAVALGAVGLGGVAFSSSASAFTVTLRSDLDDAGFNTSIDNGTFVEEFVAQSRIGNNATNGTQEFDLLDPSNNSLPVSQGQRVWPNDIPVDFSLAYDGANVDYTVGGDTISGAFFGPVTDLFIRTRTSNTNSTTSSIALFDLMLNSTSISPSLFTTSGVEYLQISDISGVPFLLEGKSTFAWTGAIPKNSQLAYQIKAGTTEPVPEPASMLGGAIALGWGAHSYRRKQKSSRTPDAED